MPVRGSRGRSLSDLTTINAYKSHLIVTKLPPSFTSWLDWFTHYTYKPVCFGELSICFYTMCLIQIYKHTMKFHQRYFRTFLYLSSYLRSLVSDRLVYTVKILKQVPVIYCHSISIPGHLVGTLIHIPC